MTSGRRRPAQGSGANTDAANVIRMLTHKADAAESRATMAAYAHLRSLGLDSVIVPETLGIDASPGSGNDTG